MCIQARRVCRAGAPPLGLGLLPSDRDAERLVEDGGQEAAMGGVRVARDAGAAEGDEPEDGGVRGDGEGEGAGGAGEGGVKGGGGGGWGREIAEEEGE